MRVENRMGKEGGFSIFDFRFSIGRNLQFDAEKLAERSEILFGCGLVERKADSGFVEWAQVHSGFGGARDNLFRFAHFDPKGVEEMFVRDFDARTSQRIRQLIR